jgi:hypothetical protein
MVGWLSARAEAASTVTIDPDAVGRSFGAVGWAPDGGVITERAVSLGPIGLFAIMTTRNEPGSDLADDTTRSAPDREAPTVFFFNAGVIDHLGPARLWVRLSRQWAQAGLRSIRFDFSGIGDSPVHVGQPAQEVYSSDALDDVGDVLRAALPADPSNAVLVGLCSGAYFAVEQALADRVRGLCVVNPILTFNSPAADPDDGSGGSETAAEGRRQVKGGMKGWVRAIPAYDQLNKLVQRMPSSAWWIVNRLAVDTPPARRLAHVVATGANVFVIAGTDEGRWLRGGETRTLHKLEQTGRFRMEVIPGLEHTLFERRTREIAANMLSEHVSRNFAPSRTADARRVS